MLEKDGVEAYGMFRFQRSAQGRIRVGGNRRYVRDTYESEIAAYFVNGILGMDNIPPTVYRKLYDRQGTVQLWLEEAMADKLRNERRIMPPDVLNWNRQFCNMRVRVFDNLINSIDRDQGNIMIDKDSAKQ